MSISTAVAQQSKPTAAAMVTQYRQDFASVLPTHIKPDTWVRVAQGALKRGKFDRSSGMYELEVAALNNPGKFLAALLEAARLGLEPGTDEYYLTPRKEKGQLQILGITGYQGYIELMYRAGAVSSVVAEVVYDRDKFEYMPGRDEVPRHEIDWDADDRGSLRLVYAYARMKDGATSRVVVLNKSKMAEIKSKAQGSSSEYSPWQTSTADMWLKSAVRQLRKWVPTSSEYLDSRRRVEVEAPSEPPAAIEAPSRDRGDVPEGVDPSTGEVVEAEFMDEPDDFDVQS